MRRPGASWMPDRLHQRDSTNAGERPTECMLSLALCRKEPGSPKANFEHTGIRADAAISWALVFAGAPCVAWQRGYSDQSAVPQRGTRGRGLRAECSHAPSRGRVPTGAPCVAWQRGYSDQSVVPQRRSSGLSLRLSITLVDRWPVDDVEEGLNVVGTTVLIFEVVGVLPHVEA